MRWCLYVWRPLQAPHSGGSTAGGGNHSSYAMHVMHIYEPFCIQARRCNSVAPLRPSSSAWACAARDQQRPRTTIRRNGRPPRPPSNPRFPGIALRPFPDLRGSARCKVLPGEERAKDATTSSTPCGRSATSERLQRLGTRPTTRRACTRTARSPCFAPFLASAG